jgi:hypothetical protein
LDLHEDLGLEGQPLSSSEIQLLEQMHPDDDLFRIDVEGNRNDIQVSRGFGNGYAFNIRISSIDVGGPNWDAVSTNFHNLVGIEQNDRLTFPRGQTLVYVRTPEQAIELRNELDGSGMADAGLSFSGPAGRFAGGEHRWVASLDLPTGDEGTLGGSGGWDVGLRGFSTWRAGRGFVRLANGFTWLDRNGSWLGVKRNNTWHVYLEYSRALTRRLAFRLATRSDESPLADFTPSRVGRQSWLFYLGARVKIGDDSWITLDFGEDESSFGLGPDFSFHVQLGTRIGGSRMGLLAMN